MHGGCSFRRSALLEEVVVAVVGQGLRRGLGQLCLVGLLLGGVDHYLGGRQSRVTHESGGKEKKERNKMQE